MTGISSISEFLLQAGTQYRIYDMGRGIRKLTSQAFLDIENGAIPHPYPQQQHAKFGIVFWNKTLSDQQYIWFIKLPVDEQGLLISATRNHFLEIIVEALGKEFEKADKKNGQLPENPYTFIPAQQQLSDFNSISKVDLKLKPSEHYSKAHSYFETNDINLWQHVPLQGLSDLVARIDEGKNTELLTERLFTQPEQVLFPLLSSMENQALPTKLAEKICHWTEKQRNAKAKAYGLRALSQSKCTGLVQALIESTLASEHGIDTDVLVVIGGRHWLILENDTILSTYMEKLAEVNIHQPIFTAMYADLVQIPTIRPQLLAVLRKTDKSQVLTDAIGQLFSGQS